MVNVSNKKCSQSVKILHHWGCNFQSAIARMFHDIVKKEADIPVIALEQDDLGRGATLEQTRNRLEAFLELFAWSAAVAPGKQTLFLIAAGQDHLSKEEFCAKP